MLITKNLAYTYPGRNKISFPDLLLENTQHCLILGKSGVGKTTFLHVLSGLLKPSEGSITIDDQDLYKLSAVALDLYRGQKIGMIFQQPYFMQAVTVSENLAWAQQFAGKAVDHDRIDELLTRLEIIKHKNHLPSRMSVGEQQRASIARALVNKPSIILADEPTSALDDLNASEVVNLMREQAQQDGSSLIIVTHDARIKQHFHHQITLG